MTHDIFVSYPHPDKPTADAVVNALENRGVRCWVAPRDVPPGADWAGSIIEAIDGCRLVVLVFSSATNDSEHIAREVRAASDAGVAIVPFRIEEVDPSPSLRYYLGGTHWLDALTEPLEDHLAQLADTVASMVGVAVTAPDAAASPPISESARPGERWWRRVPAAARVGAVVGAAAVLVVIGMVIASTRSDEPAANEDAGTSIEDPAAEPSEGAGPDEDGRAESAGEQPPAGPVDDAESSDDFVPPDAPHIAFTLANRWGPNLVCDMWNGVEFDFGCFALDGDVGPATDVVLADLDGDGPLDHAFAGGEYREDGVPLPDTNTLCLTAGTSPNQGPFDCSDISSDVLVSQSIVAADFDQSGTVDLLIGNSVETEPPYSPPLSSCLGDGSGRFDCGAGVDIELDMNLAPMIDDIAVADMDDDGDLDAVLAVWQGANQLCLHVEGGDFTCSAVEGEQAFSTGVAVGDFDEDGVPDVVFANYGTPNRRCLGDGAGTFDCLDISSPANPSFAVEAGDLNHDGHLDLVIGRADSNDSFDLDDENRDEVCLGDGSGTFDCSVLPYEKGEGALDLVLQDIDDDGLLDYISVGLSNVVCLGAGDGSFACTPFWPQVSDERGFEVPTFFNGIALHELRE